MSIQTFYRMVGQEHPSIPLDWYDHLTSALRDLSSGYTGTVKITAPSARNTALVTCTGVTLAATSPNFVLTITDANYTTLLSAWGETLPAHGAPFLIFPLLADGSGNNDKWPKNPKLELWLEPALA